MKGRTVYFGIHHERIVDRTGGKVCPGYVIRRVYEDKHSPGSLFEVWHSRRRDSGSTVCRTYKTAMSAAKGMCKGQDSGGGESHVEILPYAGSSGYPNPLPPASRPWVNPQPAEYIYRIPVTMRAVVYSRDPQEVEDLVDLVDEMLRITPDTVRKIQKEAASRYDAHVDVDLVPTPAGRPYSPATQRVRSEDYREGYTAGIDWERSRWLQAFKEITGRFVSDAGKYRADIKSHLKWWKEQP